VKITVAYSSKDGLKAEYLKHFGADAEISDDFFAEGDSPETINGVMNALRKKGFEVNGVESDDDALENLSKSKPDIVFNVAEGLFGDFRESYIPMICERLGLRYTGSDPLTLALSLNKARTKEVLSYYSVPNAAFRLVGYDNLDDLKKFTYPVIVKPVAEGSSKGIFDKSVADDFHKAKEIVIENLEKYKQPVIVEEFLDGDEFTVALWGNGDDLEVLPIVAISYDELPQGARKIYSYEAKWIWDTPDKPLDIFQCPAKVTDSKRKEIEAVVKRTYQVLNIRDWCRIDVRLDSKGVPHIIELNPLPGILPKPEDNSCFPKAARTAGYAYEDMLNKVILTALKRYGIKV